jgi:alkylhydroperoxidase family enzyme
MARIKGVSSAQAGLQLKIAYHFTRRSIAKLTGRETEQMIEPLQMYAHVPVLFHGYAKLEQATAKLHRLDKRLHALAELKAATLTHCEYCSDMGSAISRQWGLTDEEILALPSYQASPLFSELDKLVLDYAVGMTRTPVDVPDELFDRLRQHLDDGQIVELTHHIALENMRGRFNLALGIGPAGSATAWCAPSRRCIHEQSVAVHPGTAAVEQDRPASAGTDRPVDGPADGWWQRDQDDLGALSAYAQHPGGHALRRGRRCRPRWPEDPQAQQPEHGYQGEVTGTGGLPGRGQQGLELQLGESCVRQGGVLTGPADGRGADA